MIKLICVGKIKENYLTDLISDYSKRITKYHKFELIEVKDSTKELEAKEISKYIGSQDYVIALCIEGKQMDSLAFAQKIDFTFLQHGTITFIIGGSYGIDDSIKARAHFKLSFSDMTFPHGLFRGVLLEQIYRAFKINSNETHHK